MTRTCFIYAQQWHVKLLVGDVFVYADDDALFGINLALIARGGFGNFALLKTAFNRWQNAAEFFDFIEISICLLLQTVRQGFEEIAAAERVNGVRDACFFGDDLLGA